ncbi:glycosyltransferase, partial [Patescibacteria group bacterium]|nr:glycosyltransferase [Patescibacteria group bacterium]
MAFASDISVIVPGRNEQFMRHTIEDVLAHAKADTEVIAVCDASWPEPPVVDHPKVKILHTTEPIGQRAATNAGA